MLGSMQLESTPPSPRSDVSEAPRRARLGGRVSSRLRPWLETGAGAAPRLNGPSSQVGGCCGSCSRGHRARRSSDVGCAGAAGMNMTCSRILDRCSASSSRILHPPPLRRS